jgi:hypothetical protein
MSSRFVRSPVAPRITSTPGAAGRAVDEDEEWLADMVERRGVLDMADAVMP